MNTWAQSTLTVCASGCDYTTIQAAIYGASSGDTIHISNGNYNEPINTVPSPDKNITVAPGASPGCDTVTGMTLGTGDVLAMEIFGTTECTQYDQFKVNGMITLNGATLTIDLGSFTPAVNDAFTIINNDGTDAVSGEFAQGLSIIVGTYTFIINYSGGDGNDVVLTCAATNFPVTYAAKQVKPIGAISLPVMVNNFNNVAAISLYMNFDPAILAYTGFTPHTLLSGMDVGNPSPGLITISWWGSAPGVVLPGSMDTIVNLNFTFAGGTSLLTWDNDQEENCEYAYPVGSWENAPYPDDPASTYYIPGWVTNLSVDFTRTYSPTPGTITAVPGGGTSLYTYSWTGPVDQTSTDQTITPEDGYGIYTVVVTDALGATTTGTYYYGPVHNINTYIDYATIQGGINATETLDGHTLLVDAGTYNEDATTSTGTNTGKLLTFVGATDVNGKPTSIINGSLYLNNDDGQSLSNIIFIATTGHLLRLRNTNTLTITNCVFDGDGRFMSTPRINGISSESSNSDITVQNCLFTNGLYVSIDATSTTNLTVNSSTFYNVKSGINFQGTENLTVTTSIFNVVAQGPGNDTYCVRFGSATGGPYNNLSIANCVLNVDKNGLTADPGTYHSAVIIRAAAAGTLAVNNCSINGEVVNLSTTMLDATCNWYGTTDGDLISPMIAGTVDYNPWLTNGTDNEVATPGFQPVSNSCNGSPVVIESALPDNIICGETTGSIAVTFSGGIANYTVDWGSGSATGVTESPYAITGLAVGSYTITVTDTNGSSATYGPVSIQYLPVTNVTNNPDTYYPTIQAAIDAAADNDVIYLCAGTYNEDATTSTGTNTGKLLTFVGATDVNGNPTSIINGSLYLNNDDGQSLSNIKFMATNGHLLRLRNTNTLAITNCVFDGNGRFMGTPAVNGISSESSNSDITVQNCLFQNGLYVSISANGTTFLTVNNSTFDNVKSGINWQGSDNLTVTNSVFNVEAQAPGSDTYCVRFGSATGGPYNNLSIANCVLNVDKNGLTADPGIYHSAVIIRAAAAGALAVNNCSINGEVVNLSTTMLDATCNWYGTADGDLITPMIAGTVDYHPWLTNGTDNDGATPGFQPVSNSCNGSPVVIGSALPDNIICGETTGSIAVTFSGGVANYTIDWGTGSASGVTGSPYTITGLAVGSYTITVTDANGSSAAAGPLVILYQPVHNVTKDTYYADIQVAINDAIAGDEIHVCAGTYSAPINIDRPLTLLGPNYNVSPITGSRVDEAIITGNIGAATAAVTIGRPNNTISGVTIKGFKITSITGTNNGRACIGGGHNFVNYSIANNVTIEKMLIDNNNAYGIYTNGHLILDHWTIHDNRIQNITFSSASAILPWKQTNLSITDNVISNSPNAGINVSDVNVGLVNGNTITNVSYGIQVGYNSTYTTSGINITNNTVSQANKKPYGDYGGIRLYGSTQISGTVNITNNFVSNSYNGVAVVSGQPLPAGVYHVNNNSITGNTNAAINHGGSGTLDATCNWYGVACKPSVTPLIKGAAASVTISPWLVNGTDSSVDPGFQPVPGSCAEPIAIGSAVADNIICGETTGSILVTFSGGSGPYNITWTGGSASGVTSPYDITGLAAGVYNITVTDANSCTGTSIATILYLPVTNVTNIPNTYYATIQAAIDAAVTSDEIDVCAGTYNEQVIVNKAIDVRGPKYGVDGNDPSRGTGEAIIDGTGLTPTQIGLVRMINTNGSSSLDGFTLRNASPVDGTRFTIDARGDEEGPVYPSAMNISHNILQGVGHSVTTEDYGLNSKYNKSNFVFSYNKILNFGGNALLFENHTGPAEIGYNHLTVDAGCGSAAMFFMSFKDGYNNENEVTGKQFLHHNTINANGESCIYMNSAFYGTYGKYDNVEISDNTITNVGDTKRGVTLNVSDPTGGFVNPLVTRNTISPMNPGTGTSNRGIFIHGNVSIAQVSGNSISGFYQGLYQDGSTPGSQITANTITGGNYGIDIAGGNLTGCTNNFITANTTTGVMIESTSGTVGAITNNDLSGNPAGNAINNQLSTQISAECNWYGMTDYAGVTAKNTGNVDYVPWLVAGTDIGDPGFVPGGTCNGSPVIIASAVPDPIICGETNGSILVTFSGGVANYTIDWGSGSATGVTGSPYAITGLAVGPYTITVTDTNGSSATYGPVSIQYLPVTNISDDPDTYYPTIQAAIDAATTDNGDVIDVCAGTYNETLLVNKGVTILGPNAAISPNTGSRVPEAIITGNIGSVTAAIRISADNVALKGLKITGITGTSAARSCIGGGHNFVNYTQPDNVLIEKMLIDGNDAFGIYTNGNLILDHWTIHDNKIQNLTFANASAILPWKQTNLTITDNMISNIGFGGINVADVNTGLVNNNKITNVNANGIQVAYNSTYTTSNINITNNTVDKANTSLTADYGGIRLYGSTQISGFVNITNNTVTNSYNGIAVKDGVVLPVGVYHVNNNSITGNTNYAIYHGGTGTLDATCNWFGFFCEPDVIPEISAPANVTYSPYLINGNDNSVDPGFQPVPGSCAEPIAIGSAVADNIICGETTGSILVTFSGGSGPYNITWTGGSASGVTSPYDITGLAAGVYNITVTDANSCTGTSIATILYLPVTNVTNNPDTYYATIQAAIDDAADNDVIYLCARTYNEDATTSTGTNTGKLLTFVGATAVNGNPTSIINGSLYLNNDDGQSLSNIKFMATNGHLLRLRNTNTLAITNCVFDGNGRFMGTPAVNGINLEYSPNGNSNITVQNCLFQNGLYVSISANGTTFLTVTNSTFDNVKSGINWQGSDNLTVTNSVFNVEAQAPGSDTYCVRFGSATGGPYNNLSIANCVLNVDKNGLTAGPGIYHSAVIIRAAAAGALAVNNCSINGEVVNLSTTMLDATCNWYGTADGDLIAPMIAGTVDYDPWLTNGTDNEVATPGFQPVSGSCNGSPVVIGSALPDDITCGETTGSILVTFSGGVAKYTVDWGTGSASGVTGSPYNITGLAVGSYTITVTDSTNNNDTYGPVSVQYLPVTNVTNVPNTYYATIQGAIDAATTLNGDVINICAGTYTENVIVSKELTLNGAGMGSTIVIPALSAPDPSGCSGGSLCAGSSTVFLVQAHNITIQNLTVDGNNPSLTSGFLSNGVDVDARNGIITDHTSGTFNNLNVNNVTVKNIYLRGIQNSNGTGFNFHHDTVTNVSGTTNNSIAMCNSHGSGTFASNTISYSMDGITSNYSKGTTYNLNVISQTGTGIHSDNNGAEGGTADTISNNQVSNGVGSNSYGIFIFTPYKDIQVLNNSVSNYRYGFASGGQYEAVNPLVSGNTFINGYVGILTTGEVWGYDDGNQNITLTNNDVQNFTLGLYMLAQPGKTNTTTASNNVLGGIISYGAYIYNAGCTANLTSNNITCTGASAWAVYVPYGTANLNANSISSPYVGVAIRYSGASASLANNTISNADYGVYAFGSGKLTSAYNNVITNNYYGLRFAADAAVMGNINNNDLSNNTVAISNGTAYQANANCNWYGTADGDLIAPMIAGTVDYDPWLTNGTDDEGATPGFQPVSGSCNGSPVVIESALPDNIICGEATGSIAVTFSGGVANYTVDWGSGSATGVTESPYDITGLDAGNYTITVTDTNGTASEEYGPVTILSLPVTNTTDNPDTYYATIQTAINAADPGDVIEVCAGTYTEQLLIQKDLTLTGAGIGSTIIQPPTGTGNCVSGITGVGANWDTDYLLAAYPTDWNGAATTGTPIQVKVTGFTFDANNTTPSCGSRYTGVFFGCVKGTDYADAGLFSSSVINFGTTYASATGVRILGDSKLSVKDCDNIEYTINGIAAYGDLSGAADPDVLLYGNTMICSLTTLSGDEYALNICFGAMGTISNNTVTDAADRAVLVSSSNNINVTGNTIANQAYGIFYYNATGGTASGNQIDDGGTGIYLYNATGVTVTGNTITDETANGITLDNSGSNHIGTDGTGNGNTITNFVMNGIEVNGNNNQIYGNTISDNTGYCYAGISIYDASGNTVLKNAISNIKSGNVSSIGNAAWAIGTWDYNGTATNNSIGDGTCANANIITNSDASIVFAGTGTGNTAKGNSFSNNLPFGLNNVGGAVVDATLNWWGSATGPTVASNPCGAGDPLTNETNVTYEAWVDANCNPVSILDATASVTTPITCYGGTGTVTITANDGITPYTFVFNGVTQVGNGVYTDIVAGVDYPWSVTDANLCVISGTLTLTQPPLLSATVSKTDLTCYGSNNGTITVSEPYGGYGTYEYRLDAGTWQSSGNFTSLAPATYSVQIRDAAHTTCVIVLGGQTINEPAVALSCTAAEANKVTCKGGTDGEATVTPIGGWGLYSYSWNTTPAQTTVTATGLTAGTYSVTVTDAAGCTTTCSATVTEPSDALSCTAAETNKVTCKNGTDGEATVTPAGGWSTSYTYLWSDPLAQTTVTATGLTAGTYTVTVTDAEGCTTTSSATVTEPAVALSCTAAETIKVTCYGGADGEATVTPVGGWSTLYTFLWSDPSAQTTVTATGLTAGTYTVTVTDAEGCTTTSSATVTEPAVVNATETLAAHVNVTCNGGNDGSFTVVATGGTSPYTYSIDGTTWQVSNVFSGLTANIYTVNVNDVNNCADPTPLQVTISQSGPITVSGVLTYHNPPANTVLNNVTIELKQGATVVYSAITATNGSYTFSPVCPGTYDVAFTTNKPVGGINSTDAGQVNGWFTAGALGTYPSIERVRFNAGDVDNDTYILTADAAWIQSYFVHSGYNPPSLLWEFWKQGESVTTQPQAVTLPQIVIPVGSPPIVQNFYGMVSGDFNRSFVPGAAKSSSSTLTLIDGQTIQAVPDMTIDLPVRVQTGLQVGAVSLILEFPGDYLSVESVYLQENPSQLVEYNVTGNELRIGWNSINALSLNALETMLTIRVKTNSQLMNGGMLKFELAEDPLNELADETFEVIQDAVIIMDMISCTTTGIVDPTSGSQLSLNSYPNPFNGMTNIRYSLPYDGNITLEVTDLLGKRLMMLADQQQLSGSHLVGLNGKTLPQGVYLLTLRLESPYGIVMKTIRVVKQ